MENKDRNIKRVDKQPKTEYSASGRAAYNPNIRRITHDDFDDEEYAREIRYRKKHQMQRINRLKAVAVFVLAVIMVFIVLFLTPLFNVKNISVSGNNVVTVEQIEAQVGYFVGENLFSVSKKQIRASLMEISMIDGVEINKKLIPPTIVLEISEFVPSGYLKVNEKNIIVNEELKVVENVASVDVERLPQIFGVDALSVRSGKPLKLTDIEKEETLKVFLNTFMQTGLTEHIDYIDMSDIANLKFSFENRIEAECGSDVELSRKLRMFKETVTSSSLNENSKGTIDLSIPGKAIYAP